MGTKGHNQAGTVTHYEDAINRGRATGGVWKTCPLLAQQCDPQVGFMIDEQWANYDATDDYTLTQAVAGAAAISTAAPGVLELDANSTTATQGANLQRLGACFVPAANKHIWAEFRLKIVDTFDKAEIFVGLSESDTTIIAGSANSSANHIGWQCVTDDGVLLFTSEKAGAGDTGAAATIAEDTYISLGFYVNGITSITQYVNGVETGTAKATANVPIVALYPSFVCQSGGTNDPIMHIAAYRVFQLR